MNQAAYSVGKNKDVTFLPRSGYPVLTELCNKKPFTKVSDILTVGNLKKEIAESKENGHAYFSPNITLVNVHMWQDQTKCGTPHSAALTSDKSKLSEIEMNYLCI